MAKFLTEDEARDACKASPGFDRPGQNVKRSPGQLTAFDKLRIKGDGNKSDGWYLPDNKNDVAIILESKNSGEDIARFTNNVATGGRATISV